MDGIVIELASSLNRFRSLTDEESRWLEAAIRREERRNGNGRLFWEPRDDMRLRRFIRNGRKPRDIARAMGRTEQAVWCRIKYLRRRGKIGYYRPEWAKLAAQGPMAQVQAAEG